MPDIVASPYAITTAILKLGANTFTKAINMADCQPSYQNATFDSIDGVSTPIADTAAWVLALMVAQDWALDTSFVNYLAQNDGQFVAFEYTPAVNATKKVTGTVLVRAGNIGGTARQGATSTITLPIKGTPLLVAV